MRDCVEFPTHSAHNVLTIRRYYGGRTTRDKAEAFLKFGPDDLERMPKPARPKTKRIEWPPDDVLKAMLVDRPATYIAHEPGCSDSRLSAHSKDHGTPKLGRGVWRDWKRNQVAT
jgi:hypothetical protein